MKLTWHYPAFVDTVRQEEAEFNSVEEFYALPRIVELSNHVGFDLWSVSRGRQNLLMKEYVDGSYWVIAYLSEDAVLALNLPDWSWHRSE